MQSTKTVDDYIAQTSKEVRDRLVELRAIIKASVPGVEERISYAMPSYHYKGRLIYFAVWKNHIGLYGLSGSVIEIYKDQLKGYVMSKGTIQLPLSEKLPVGLIKKLVKAQVKNNEEKK